MRYTAFVTAVSVGIWILGAAAQQARPDNQPGRKWTEAQLREASGHVRAGRSLTPKAWPNGARVAVALTFNVSNSANQLARGDTAVVAMTGGEFGAAQGLPRVLELLDRHDVPATFFVAGVADLVDPQMVPEIVKRKRHEIGLLGWSDENVAALDNAGGRIATADARDRASDRVGGTQADRRARTVGHREPAHDGTAETGRPPLRQLAAGERRAVRGAARGAAERHRGAAEQRVSQRPALPDVGPHGTGAAAVAGADLRNVPGRLRHRLSRRDALRPDAAPARRRHAVADHLPRSAGAYIKGKPGVWFATGEQIARYVKQQAGLTN